MITGTAIEVAGTFLLAVEAIKLPNLRFVRDRILKVAALKVNPIIQFVDKETSETRAAEVWIKSLFVFFIALGLSLFYAVLRLTGNSVSDVWRVFSSVVPGPIWCDIVVAVPAVFVLLVLSSVGGTSVYTLVVVLLDGAIAMLSFIEKHTASGIVGILGFVTFLLGAMIKIYAYWRGA